MQSPYRVGNHSNRSRRHLSSYHLLRSNQVHERLRVEVWSEKKGIRDARGCDALDSHQRGISINESAVEPACGLWFLRLNGRMMLILYLFVSKIVKKRGEVTLMNAHTY
jgi:hypothetical protein